MQNLTDLGMDNSIKLSDFLSNQKRGSDDQGLFVSMTAKEWLEQSKSKPIPKMLFDELWFEGELCVLIADTNQGKSILAVQIADSISRGVAIDEFSIGVEAQPVLYFDFELSEKQFEARYSEQVDGSDFYHNQYEFDKFFIRSEINPNCNPPKHQSYDDWLLDSLIREIRVKNAKVIIIDNITFLKSELEKSKDAAPFIQKLKRLKDQEGLSILILAHTPKIDMSRPININHISGSKAIANFIDSAFAIGESQKSKAIKYIKQIKVRHKEFKYHAGNVMVCAIIKKRNFLQLEPKYTEHEQEHLRIFKVSSSTDKALMAFELKNQGFSNIEIGKKIGVSEKMVRNYLKMDKEELKSRTTRT